MYSWLDWIRDLMFVGAFFLGVGGALLYCLARAVGALTGKADAN